MGTLAQAVRARAAGEREDDYRRYLTITQGEQARDQARARGVDTSGQYWDGGQFRDADAGPMKFISEHPGIGLALALAPAAPFALSGLLGGGGASAATAAAPAAASTGGGGGMVFGGLKLGDLLKGGVDLTSLLLGNAATNTSARLSAQAAQDALTFAKQQYGDQNALEQSRYAASEARRVPFRRAATDSLVALKQLIGLPR